MVQSDESDFELPHDEDRDGEWGAFSKRLEGFVPETVMRKAAGAIKGVIQTEEVVRSVLGEVSKELVVHAREQIEKGKGDLVNLVSREFRDFLEKTDFSGEVRKILTELELEVTTQIRFVEKKDGGVEARASGTRSKRKPSKKKAKAQ